MVEKGDISHPHASRAATDERSVAGTVSVALEGFAMHAVRIAVRTPEGCYLARLQIDPCGLGLNLGPENLDLRFCHPLRRSVRWSSVVPRLAHRSISFMLAAASRALHALKPMRSASHRGTTRIARPLGSS